MSYQRIYRNGSPMPRSVLGKIDILQAYSVWVLIPPWRDIRSNLAVLYGTHSSGRRQTREKPRRKGEKLRLRNADELGILYLRMDLGMYSQERRGLFLDHKECLEVFGRLCPFRQASWQMIRLDEPDTGWYECCQSAIKLSHQGADPRIRVTSPFWTPRTFFRMWKSSLNGIAIESA